MIEQVPYPLAKNAAGPSGEPTDCAELPLALWPVADAPLEVHTETGVTIPRAERPPQPPEPHELFPYSDPERQLTLHTLAARLAVAMANNKRAAYRQAERGIPPHRVYSFAVQACLRHPGNPVTKNELAMDFRRVQFSPKSKWVTLETIARLYGDDFEHVARQADWRAQEIVPVRNTRRRTKSAQARDLRRIAWEQTQRLRQATIGPITDVWQAAYRSGQRGSAPLMTIDYDGSTTYSGRGATILQVQESRRPAKPVVGVPVKITSVKPASVSRRPSQTLLRTLDKKELVKGIVRLDTFPALTNPAPEVVRTKGQKIAELLIKSNVQIGTRHSTAEITTTEAMLLCNALLLLGQTPVHVSDMAGWLEVPVSKVIELFLDVQRRTHSSSKYDRIFRGDDTDFGNRHTISGMSIFPTVRIFDLRSDAELRRAPKTVFKCLGKSAVEVDKVKRRTRNPRHAAHSHVAAGM